MKKVLAALMFIAASFAVHAQDVRVVTSCGSSAPFPPPAPGSSFQYTFIDSSGNLCTNASGASTPGGGYGSGAPAPNSFSVYAFGTPIAAASGSDTTGSLPANSNNYVEAILQNASVTISVKCALGASTASGYAIIPPLGQWDFVAGAATQATCQGIGGTANVNIITGTSQNHTDLGAAIPAGTNLIGGTTPAAGTTFGSSIYHVRSATTAGGVVASIKSSAAGTLYGYKWTSVASAGVSVRFYDVATLAACNSGTGLIDPSWLPPAFTATPTTVGTAPGGAFSEGGGVGVAFTNGLGICITGVDADNDATAAVVGFDITVFYK